MMDSAWSKELPTEPGWYWWRQQPTDPPDARYVHADDDGALHMSDGYGGSDPVEGAGGEWQRVEEPKP